MRSLGVMTSRGEAPYRRGNEVIVRTPRGLEVGQVLCEAAEDALSHLDNAPSGQVIRQVTTDDANEVNRIDGSRISKLDACQKHIDSLGLEMKLVDVEQLFGGERMIVFYLAEDRVDFRELVKLLAAEFQTRIEMKQIGVRDEAKLLADYGDCGKPVCCNNHLVSMPPVSMKMAKLQKATLDPTKISGRCGRLKCCLRYEFDHYDQSFKAMPRVGQHIVTRKGRAKVIAQRVLLEQLLVETEDHRRIVIDTSEVLTVLRKDEPVPDDVAAMIEVVEEPLREEPKTDEKRRSKERKRRKPKDRMEKQRNDGEEANEQSSSDDDRKPARKRRRRNRSSSSKPRSERHSDRPEQKTSDKPKANRDSAGKKTDSPGNRGADDKSAAGEKPEGSTDASTGRKKRSRRGGRRSRNRRGGGGSSGGGKGTTPPSSES